MIKIGSSLSYPKIIESLTRIEVELIDKFISQVKNKNEIDTKKLEQTLNNLSRKNFLSDFDYDSYVESQSDEFQILNEIEILSFQLSIVALYRIVEIRTKSILSISSNFNPNEIRSVFNFNNLKKMQKENLI